MTCYTGLGGLARPQRVHGAELHNRSLGTYLIQMIASFASTVYHFRKISNRCVNQVDDVGACKLSSFIVYHQAVSWLKYNVHHSQRLREPISLSREILTGFVTTCSTLYYIIVIWTRIHV